MKHVRSLFLRSAGSLALFVCAVAARADSIPNVTATTAHYSDVYGVAQWGVGGDSFEFSGEGLPPVVKGSGYPGQSLADFGVTNVPFAAFRGPV